MEPDGLLGVRASPDADLLLAVWERAVGLPAHAREQALLGFEAAEGEPLTVGECNARLLALHNRLFGSHLDLLSHCPACGTAVEFGCETSVLTDVSDRHDSEYTLTALGHRLQFRLPAHVDVTAATVADNDAEFARHLLERCVLSCSRDDGSSVSPLELPEPVLEALSDRMEALDPAASVWFALACPRCEARWDGKVDVGAVLWQKIQAAAERVLLDIDALARAYGWTEQQVLQLSPVRRAAYLQMATA